MISKLIIFPWQAIGLLRASDKDYLINGNTYKTRLIQLLIVVAIGFILITAIDTIQTATFKKKQQEIADEYSQFVSEQSNNYTLSLHNNSTQLVITGELDIGITKAVTALLAQHPQISNVVLNSIGGHIYEGRGLSQLFTSHNLNTYVYKQCSSACTTAFSGGLKRYIGASGKLGFHQYKQDLQAHKKAVGFHNAGEEQKRDLALFKSRGIDDEFLLKIFDTSADSMWFPSQLELLNAGVIHQVMNTGTENISN